MGAADAPHAASDQVEAALVRLRVAADRIRVARAALAPLEAGLAVARREFDQRVGPLRREERRIENEIEALKAPVPDREFTSIFDDDRAQSWPQPAVANSAGGRDAVAKDELLEHLVRVLDPDIDESASMLLARIQGLCNDPATGLADVLEELPWGQAWTARQRSEAVQAQYRRLAMWEAAMGRQLATLAHAQERLVDGDPWYRLYQQRQRGPAAWEAHLDQAAQRQLGRNRELQAELDDLRASRPHSQDAP
jgi:hypothetical protein